MSYLDQLKLKNSETFTLNGAKTWSTTGNACLDLFAVAGGMRYRKAGDLISLFERAYIEEPETAMKLLFYIRDIRGGMGERRVFRILLRHVAKTWPKSAEKNVRLISEYGRFDDLFCLLGTPSENEVIKVVRAQLDSDLAALEERKNGNVNAHISLLAKWMPSINTSSFRACKTARRLAKALGMAESKYRKMLSALRANICLAERYLTEKRPEKVQYSAVPAGAMLKYCRTFERKDKERFEDFILSTMCGVKTLHADTLFPYEIIRPFFDSYSLKSPDCRDALEALWCSLPKTVSAENAISVVDTSGSMFWILREKQVQPILIAVALGLYHAENCKGAFHNHFITFESNPHLIEIHGKTLEDKLSYICSAPCGFSTNLEAVFDLLLDTAIKFNTLQDELPSTLYIISDMEFNCAVSNPNDTVFENAKKSFEANGYHLPVVVFINVNSWQMQTPVRAHDKGSALMSGASVHSFKERCDPNTTPLNHMYKILLSDRYKEVHA